VVARARPGRGSNVVGLEQGRIKVQVEDYIGVVVSGAASSDGFSTGGRCRAGSELLWRSRGSGLGKAAALVQGLETLRIR
jgi:hypothetical protein